MVVVVLGQWDLPSVTFLQTLTALCGLLNLPVLKLFCHGRPEAIDRGEMWKNEEERNVCLKNTTDSHFKITSHGVYLGELYQINHYGRFNDAWEWVPEAVERGVCPWGRGPGGESLGFSSGGCGEGSTWEESQCMLRAHVEAHRAAGLSPLHPAVSSQQWLRGTGTKANRE